MEMKWFESHDNLIELAHWLLVDGWFTYPIDLLRYFEKPWKWEDEWDKMNAGPTEEQLGLDDPEDWAKQEPDGVPSIAELYMEERHEDEDEDLRPTDLILSSDPGWITP